MLYDTGGDIGIVTMNRPEKLNAISHELRTAVSDWLIRADDDEAVNVIILRAAGPAFCVGYDIDIDNDTPERAAHRFDALKWREALTGESEIRESPGTCASP